MSTEQEKASGPCLNAGLTRSLHGEHLLENLILSPTPVPLDYDAAEAAIAAAAHRSNSSRSPSIRSHELGSNDMKLQRLVKKPDSRLITKLPYTPLRYRPRFRWRHLFCCLPKRSIQMVHMKYVVGGNGSVKEIIPTAGHPVNVTDQTVPSQANSPDSKRNSLQFTSEHAAVPHTAPDSITLPGSQKQTEVDSKLIELQHEPISNLNKSSNQLIHVNGAAIDAIDGVTVVSGTTLLEHNVHQWFNGDSSDQFRLQSAGFYPSEDDQNCGGGDFVADDLSLYDQNYPCTRLLGVQPDDCANKKCLVLDLDETLVHSWFKNVENADFVVSIEVDDTKHEIFVCKRPHLDEFLQAIGPLFECVMFTASLQKYADPVCDYIDKGSHFRHRLFREACVYHQNNLIKDLSCLGRDIDQICIVDNSPVSFLFQPNNALQIIPWYDDPDDQALLELVPYLIGLANSANAVDYLRDVKPPCTAGFTPPHASSWFIMSHLDHTIPRCDTEENDNSESVEDGPVSFVYDDPVHTPPDQNHFTQLSINRQRMLSLQATEDSNVSGSPSDSIVHQASRPLDLLMNSCSIAVDDHISC